MSQALSLATFRDKKARYREQADGEARVFNAPLSAHATTLLGA